MTIVKRGRGFGVKVWDQGRKRYRWVGTFETEKIAKREEALADLKPGKEIPSIRDWAPRWLIDYPRPAAATRLVYSEAVKRIVADAGGLKLSVDRPTARALAMSWPRNVSAVARTMWGDAKRDGIVDLNPFEDLRLPQSRGRKDIRALTETEIAELANIAERIQGVEAKAIVLTLAYTAVRPGELCMLKWANLDLAERELRVARSRDATGAEKLPKNGKERTIIIPPIALTALADVPRVLHDPYIFHTISGKRLSKANLWYIWKPIASAWIAAGHEHLDLYELRHAAATMLLERGLSHSDVAVQLGHEDGGALVMQRYGHPSKQAARQRLKAAFNESAPPQSVEDIYRQAI